MDLVSGPRGPFAGGPKRDEDDSIETTAVAPEGPQGPALMCHRFAGSALASITATPSMTDPVKGPKRAEAGHWAEDGLPTAFEPADFSGPAELDDSV
jgi:hypothetical protein